MKIYGLIGKSLSHSFSKKYFEKKFASDHIPDAEYRNFEIKDLQVEVPELRNLEGLSGLNVTIPYKNEILRFSDLLTDECQEIQAANCIKIEDGKWTAYNTDITGFEKTFSHHLTPDHKKALILGTGGASKAVAFVLKKLEIPFLFVSRKSDADSAITYKEVTKNILEEFPVVINTTPVGMFPNPENFPGLPYQYITSENYFFDLIYNPEKTLFLKKAEQKGATIVNGAGMLEIQAEESWKIWNA